MVKEEESVAQFMLNIDAYKSVVREYWGVYPELYLPLFSFIITQVEPVSWQKYFYYVKRIGGFILKAKPPSVSLKKADAILFYSTSKPSYGPAMDELADRLVKSGRSVFTMTNKHLFWKNRTVDGAVDSQWQDGYKDWLVYGFSPFQALRALFRGLRISFLLWRNTRIKAPAIYRRICNNPLGALYESMRSAHLFHLMGWLIRNADPKLIISHHEHLPIANHLLLAQETRGRKTVLFFNENPIPVLMEPACADETWVWNKAVGELLLAAQVDHKTDYKVVGSSELTYILQESGDPCAEEKELLTCIGDRKVVLFLSEYVSSDTIGGAALNDTALSWLRQATLSVPDIIFLYKQRPGQNNENPPGIRHGGESSNFIIAPGSIELKRILRWDNVIAVIGCFTTAMLVSLGVGKPTLRLCLGDDGLIGPTTLLLSIAIHSGDDLSLWVRRIADGEMPPQCDTYDEHFPYRGTTIDRMEELCLNYMETIENSKIE